jgi:hypothetical protein
MRNPFRRRPRVTTPPEVIPLVVLGIVALLVAQLALGFFALVVLIAVALVPGGGAYPVTPGTVAATAAVLLVNLLLLVLGWRFVRRLVAGWVRRQPPEPLRPAA